MRITTEMISNVIWSDMLDSDDYEGIAQSINMREGVGATNANYVKDLIQHETVDTPDIDMITQMNNLKIVY
tara:strand:+ start:4608 stop:4820 length:213 start_codon:yes stop_codon:yes gene_type:complete